MPQSLIADSLSKTFKPYNTNYDALQMQTQLLSDKLEQIKRSTDPANITIEDSLNFLLLKNQIDRNTRILKAYKYQRCKKIENAVINKIQLENMCASDIEYKNKFETMYNSYIAQCDIDFDIEMPLDFFVAIVPIEECGCIMINNEIVQLETNKMYYVKRKSVKHLIESKKVQIINKT